ncbi:type I-MYXAN CRISPR-associated protein Cas6/Cmx6 [Chromatium okenii]|uniref:type I-MYXAN CRISPR-associated protein Cas6/Cmx6 n=1 Tax=Chromatium okenii TaxID=61644 RepID=UPI001F5BB55B|nr:type I-MYXAN CRISPR-associated protein Cas6/Cmx6 [Chromatium okenii]
MFWHEDKNPDEVQIPDDIVDLLFTIDCKSIPVDHAHLLSTALQAALPWLATEPQIGLHTIHVAGSQNGWQRPAHGSETELLLSRRTKLIIRAPKCGLPICCSNCPA